MKLATIANLMVMIGANTAGLSNSLKQTQGQLKSFSSSARASGTAMTLGVTLPIVGMGVAMLKAGMDFEQAMSNIQAVSSATASEMKQLNDLSLKMGKETAFSALESAQGIEELMKAGLTTAQVLNGGLDGALALAAAGSIGLADAAEVASTALNAFKKDNLTVMQAADLLAGAANASATDVGELRLSLAQVSSVASGIGLSFADTTTALATFAQNGLKGSDAGTSLKTMLMNLIPQTKTQTAMFKQLGLLTEKGTSAFFDQTGKLKNLKDISDTLRKSMASMNEEQRFSTMQTLFGSDAIRAANILYKEGADGIESMSIAMGETSAAETAKIKMDNLKGSIDELKGSLETAAITLFQTNDGALKDFIDGLTNLVNKFTELDTKTQQWILITAGIAAIIPPVLMAIGMMGSGLSVIGGLFAPVIAGIAAFVGWIGTVVSAIGLWIGGAGTFGEAMLLISNPIGWVIAGIIALIAVGWLIYAQWDNISAFFVKVWNWMKETAVNVWNSIAEVSTTVWNTITGFLSGIWKGIKTGFSTAWDFIKKVSLDVWNGLLTFFTTTVPDGFSRFINFFKELPSKVGTFLYNLFFVDIPYYIGYGIGFMIEYLKINIPKVIQFFKELPSKVGTWLLQLATNFTTWTVNFIKSAIKFGGDVITAIINFFKTLPEKVLTWLTNTGIKLTEWTIIALTKAKNIGSAILNGIIDIVKTAPEKVWAWLLTIGVKLATFAINALVAAKSVGKNIYDGIVNWIKGIPAKITEYVGGIVSTITGIANSIAGAISSIFGNASKGMDAGKAAVETIPKKPTTIKPTTIKPTTFISKKPSPKKHALGGVFTKPTMLGNHLFGENGAEAIVPLNKYGGFGGGSQQQPIIIYLDGSKIYEGADRHAGSRFLSLGGV